MSASNGSAENPSGALSKRFEGQTALVTGAGTGIGRAIALRLAGEGASVSFLGRRPEPLEESIGMAREAGATGTLQLARCDIRDRETVEATLGVVAEILGPLDMVIANAGLGGANGPGFQDSDVPDRFEDLVATNLTGTYTTFRAAQPFLRSREHADRDGRWRHLVATSSILARIGVMGYTGYCASKAGIGGLVRAFAAELAPDNIQVNAIAPGWVKTAMATEGLAGMAEGMGITPEEAHGIAMRDVPLGRMGEPQDVAGLVAWLVSRDANGVTGQMLDMNGGAFMV